MQLLDIRNLTVEMQTAHGIVRVLDKVNLQLTEGEIHSIVGESGSGKVCWQKPLWVLSTPTGRLPPTDFGGTDRIYWQ